jgi:hypothetical protein
MAEYRLTTTDTVIRTVDSFYIPNDPLNPDRIEYEAWLAAGGVPDPALIPLPSSQYDWGPTFAQVIGPY